IVPAPAPTDPSSTAPSFAFKDCGEDFVATDRTQPNVVERAVVRLADDDIDRADIFIAGKREHEIDHGVGNARYVQRRGQHDWRLDLAELVDLRRPHQLAEAVSDEDCARYFVAKEIAAVWQDRRDAAAHVVAANECRLSDANAGDIRNGVERSGREDADRDAEVAKTGAIGE